MKNIAERERWAAFLMLAVVLLVAMVVHSLLLADRIALGGFSPIDWVNHVLLPENFAADFPSGIENYRYSFFVHLYLILESVFGVPAEVTLRVVVLVEIALLGTAVAFLVRTFAPQQSPAVAVIAAMLVLASLLGAADLSRIAVKPSFIGLFYSIAEASRLLAIAFAWRRRWFLAAGFLTFATVTHPLYGALGAMFIGVMVLARDNDWRSPVVWGAVAGYLALSAAWMLTGVAQQARVLGGEIPVDDWLAYTAALSSHWYPLEYGMLGAFHGQHLFPLLAFVVLFCHYLVRLDWAPELRRVLGWGVALLLFITALGVVFTIWLPLPVLIKLNLARADKLAMRLGLVVVIAGLVGDLVRGGWWRRVPAAVLLVSPFISAAIVPIMAAMWLALPQAAMDVRRTARVGRGARVSAVFVLAVAGVVLGYLTLSDYVDDNLIYYLGVRKAWMWAVALALLAPLAVRMFGTRVAALGVAFAVSVNAVGWLHEEFSQRWRSHPRAVDYREVQDWAREHTPTTSLYFLDPLFFYGWRDYSQRSSFGNMREWLHTSWLYDSNPGYFREGLRRFAELGIDAAPYLALRPTSTRMAGFYTDVQDRFYAMDDVWRRDIADRYGVDYFVMRSSRLGETTLPRAFENEHYVVLDVSDASSARNRSRP